MGFWVCCPIALILSPWGLYTSKDLHIYWYCIFNHCNPFYLHPNTIDCPKHFVLISVPLRIKSDRRIRYWSYLCRLIWSLEELFQKTIATLLMKMVIFCINTVYFSNFSTYWTLWLHYIIQNDAALLNSFMKVISPSIPALCSYPLMWGAGNLHI